MTSTQCLFWCLTYLLECAEAIWITVDHTSQVGIVHIFFKNNKIQIFNVFTMYRQNEHPEVFKKCNNFSKHEIYSLSNPENFRKTLPDKAIETLRSAHSKQEHYVYVGIKNIDMEENVKKRKLQIAADTTTLPDKQASADTVARYVIPSYISRFGGNKS